MAPKVTMPREMNADFDLEPLAGDASQRSYFRLRFKGENAIPKTLVLMKAAAPFDAENDDFLKLHSFLYKCMVPVPEIFFVKPERGMIYLEDLGDTLLSDACERLDEGGIFEHYRKALDILLSIQLEGSRALKKDDANPALSRRFDTGKYMEELDFTTRHFIKGHLKKELSQKDEKRLNALYMNIVKPIENEPLFLSHRDYHSRNIMVKDGKLFVIDFQDARMGPLQYDLASLLFDSYLELEEKMRYALLGYYTKRLGSASAPISTSTSMDGKKDGEFISMLYRVSLQRNLKALGTFGYQASAKNNDFYLQFVQRTINYIRQNIMRFGEFNKDAKWIVSLLEP
ncbi:MAG: phosphotransferase [Nitrospinota bacterium]